MYLPLSEYVKKIPTRRTVSPPGYHNIKRLVLTEEIQQLLRLVLALMPDRQTNTKCFFELKAEHIFVNQLSKKPFLADAVPWTPNYDENLAQMNYARVGEIFRETIFSGVVASLPRDFQELLDLMKANGHRASYAIQHHCSLVWPVDKKELFARVFDYLHGTLRNEDPKLYENIVKKLDYPEDWDIRIQQNTYLGMFYTGSLIPYNPVGLNAGKEVLRFMRNTYSHCMDHAWNRATMEQEYVREQVGEMMETKLPLVLHSLQLELDEEGLLSLTMLESLFR